MPTPPYGDCTGTNCGASYSLCRIRKNRSGMRCCINCHHPLITKK